jgi:hypothetical protein
MSPPPPQKKGFFGFYCESSQYFVGSGNLGSRPQAFIIVFRSKYSSAFLGIDLRLVDLLRGVTYFVASASLPFASLYTSGGAW